MLNFAKGKWNKNGGIVVIGNGTKSANAIVYKAICTIHGSGFFPKKEEARDNQTLICMAPDMYRTLYAQYVLGWEIYRMECCVGQIWVFEGIPTEGNPSSLLGQTKYDGTEFPVWNDELISIFEKEAEGIAP